MDKINCKKGEYIYIPSGFWIVQKGILKKVKGNKSGKYININIYTENDYLLNDINSKYVALVDSRIIAVGINEIDVVKTLHQLNSLEELIFIRGHDLNAPIPGIGIYEGRVALFLEWIQKRTSLSTTMHSLSIRDIIELFNQHTIASFLGVSRCTIARRLSAMGWKITSK